MGTSQSLPLAGNKSEKSPSSDTSLRLVKGSLHCITTGLLGRNEYSLLSSFLGDIFIRINDLRPQINFLEPLQAILIILSDMLPMSLSASSDNNLSLTSQKIPTDLKIRKDDPEFLSETISSLFYYISSQLSHKILIEKFGQSSMKLFSKSIFSHCLPAWTSGCEALLKSFAAKGTVLIPLKAFFHPSNSVIHTFLPGIKSPDVVHPQESYFVSADERFSLLRGSSFFGDGIDVLKAIFSLGQLYQLISGSIIEEMIFNFVIRISQQAPQSKARIVDWDDCARETIASVRDSVLEKIQNINSPIIKKILPHFNSGKLSFSQFLSTCLGSECQQFSNLPSISPSTPFWTCIGSILVKLQYVAAGGIGTISAPNTCLMANSCNHSHNIKLNFDNCSEKSSKYSSKNVKDPCFCPDMDDELLYQALHLEVLDHVALLIRILGFHDSAGMHLVHHAESCAIVLQLFFQEAGVLPLTGITSMKEWFPLLPLYALSIESIRSLCYLEAILSNQHRLELSPIFRSQSFRSASYLINQKFNRNEKSHNNALDSNQKHNTWKIFPTFSSSDGVLERGEGRGPRKEFFDLCARDIIAQVEPYEDLTPRVDRLIKLSEREIDVHISDTLSKSQLMCWKKLSEKKKEEYLILLLYWKESYSPALSDIRHESDSFKPNDHLVFRWLNSSKEKKTGEDSIQKLTEGEDIYRVEMTMPGKSDHSRLVFLMPLASRPLLAGKTSNPLLFESIGFEKSVIPPFIKKDGSNFCWTNPILIESENQIRFSKLFFALGWLLGNTLANDVRMQVPFPPLLFFWIQRIFSMPNQLDHSNGIQLRDISVEYLEENWEQLTQNVGIIDLNLLGDSGKDNIRNILKLNDNDFNEMLNLEDIKKGTLDRLQYIRTFLAVDMILNLGGGNNELVSCIWLNFFKGISESSIIFSPILFQCSPSHLRHIFCGNALINDEDFQFSDFFRFIFAVTESQPKHLVSFLKIILECLEEGWTKNEKLEILQFITGQKTLPQSRKTEHIRVEIETSSRISDFPQLKKRLPTSHSCDNVIEVPNYLECLLLEFSSTCYPSLNQQSRTLLTDSMKESIWNSLSQNAKEEIVESSKRIFCFKLRQAVFQSSTYELDNISTASLSAPYVESIYQRLMN